METQYETWQGGIHQDSLYSGRSLPEGSTIPALTRNSREDAFDAVTLLPASRTICAYFSGFELAIRFTTGGDLVTCARRMGHSDMRTTERYLNVSATQAQQTLVQQHSLVDSVGVVKWSAVKRRLKG